MLFSIIVPVFNTKSYLNKCVSSIVSQSFKEFELLLIDDGSTDGTSELCDLLSKSDDRIKVFHKPNGGLVSARIYGAKKCRGDYVVNIDSDDYVENEFLSSLYDVIKKNSPDCICFGYKTFDHNGVICDGGVYIDNGMFTKEKIDIILNNWLYNFMVKNGNYGCLSYGVCLKAVKTDIYKKAQLSVPLDVAAGEDTLFTANLFNLVKSIFVLDKHLYMYRILSGSMIRTFNERTFSNLEKVASNLEQIIPAGSSAAQIPMYVFMCLWDSVLLCKLSCNKYKNFKKIITKCWLDCFDMYLKRCRFKTFKQKVKMFLVKNHLWRLIYLYYKIYNHDT